MVERKLLKQAILECLQSGESLDKILQSLFREHHAGSEERAIVAEAAMTFFRFMPLFKMRPIELEKREWQHRFEDVMDTLLEKGSDENKWLARHEKEKPFFTSNSLAHLERVHGIPHFLLREMESRPEPWHELLHQFFERAQTCLRLNPLVVSREDFLLETASWGLEASPWLPNAFYLMKKKNIFQEKLFLRGAIEIQDEHSQFVSHFCEAQEGMRVLDLCAGAGGKTLHLASLMKNKGDITAHDINGKKLHLLELRARRAGFSNIRTQEKRDRIKGPFDLILVDAPCSGLGTLRRSPDRLFSVKESDLLQAQRSQGELLRVAFGFADEKTRIVYATCTVRPEENIRLLNRVLAEKDYSLTSAAEIFSRILGPRADNFMTLVQESPAFKVSELNDVGRAVQLGPVRRSSDSLVGDVFFMARVN